MKEPNTLPFLVTGIIVVAVLITVLAKGGWMVWLSVLLALAVVSSLASQRPQH